jgi:hypothetical protein
MSVYVDPASLRLWNMGLRVNRATATLPQTATATLFTVSGGRILLTSLIGNVTVATGATATNLKITSTPSAGTAVDIATNVAAASKEVGAHFSVNCVTIGALTVGNAGGLAMAGGSGGLIIPAGSIQWTTDANDTGSIKWLLTYVPLDDGAAVAAA